MIYYFLTFWSLPALMRERERERERDGEGKEGCPQSLRNTIDKTADRYQVDFYSWLN